MIKNLVKVLVIVAVIITILVATGVVKVPQSIKKLLSNKSVTESLAAQYSGIQLKVPDKVVVAGNQKCAFKLYMAVGQTAKNQGQNLFISPISIQTALGMTYAGSANNTKEQMQQVLSFHENDDVLHASFAAIKHLVTNTKSGEVSIANTLYKQDGFAFEKDYLSQVSYYYGSAIKTVDFKTQLEPTRILINRDIEDQTRGKIKDTLQKGMVNQETRMLLVNAIYAKNVWKFPFDKKQTAEQDFTLADGNKIKAKMMLLTEVKTIDEGEERTQLPNFQYWRDYPTGDSAVEIPYRGDDFSMIVLLPGEERTLSQIESEFLEEEKINSIEWREESLQVVAIPKFKIEFKTELSKPLQNMGMTDAFGRVADFSVMEKNKSLKIGKIVHKTYIDVNEEGSEAAAVTAVVMMRKLSSMPPAFEANRPFVFIIKHKTTNTIVFMGRIYDPS